MKNPIYPIFYLRKGDYEVSEAKGWGFQLKLLPQASKVLALRNEGLRLRV